MIVNKIQEFYIFLPNKPLVSLLEISPTNHIFLKTFKSNLHVIEVWFARQSTIRNRR